MPGNDSGLAREASLGYDQIYDATDHGVPRPSVQLVDHARPIHPVGLRLTECTRDRQPVMAEITLVSSHAPWAPIPRLIDWEDVGDGSVFDPMAAANDPPEAILTRNPTGYAPTTERPSNTRSAASSPTWRPTATTISYSIFLGDHQPSPIVTGPGASRDVPITIVTRDRSVLDPDRAVELAGRPQARCSSTGLADERLPRSIPDRLRTADQAGQRPA